jgi:RNA polymerase sigma factor (sigma-70 family)
MSARIFFLEPFLNTGAKAADGGLGQALGALLRPARAQASAAARAPQDPREVERFRQLLLPHMDSAYAFARYLCRDAAVAEDLVQDAYLKAYRGFSAYRGGDAKAWLFAILRTGFISWTRTQRSWSAMAGSDDEAFEAVADPGATPEEALARSGDLEALRRAVEGLPDPFRETLVLRELQEMSYRQIADITGAPVGTVMSRLARARALLAAALSHEGALG